jgi:hypothetical protein
MTDHHIHVAAAFGSSSVPSHIVAVVMPDIEPGGLAAPASSLPAMVDPAAHTNPATLGQYQSLIEGHAASIAPVQSDSGIMLVHPAKATSDVTHQHHNQRRRDSH